MKLFETYKQILNEAVSYSEIISAIDNKNIIEFYYTGDNTQNKGVRRAEIYTFGNSKLGNPVVRVFQLSGATDSNVPSWKLFLVKNMNNLKVVGQYDQQRYGFNLNGDDGMLNVYKTAKF